MPILMWPQVQSVSMVAAYRKARRWGRAGELGQLGLAGADPPAELFVPAQQLQPAARIAQRQEAAQLSCHLLGLCRELSDQGQDLILHVRCSLWAAEWGAPAPVL
jgi:hypothetical protein